MKRIVPILVLSIFWTVCTKGQDLLKSMNVYSPPSPEAASLLNKQNNYSINYHTGKLNYSAPLSSVNLNGIDIAVGIDYETSGFKVQDIASSVGLGWSASYGGVVSRYVEGLPDEEENGYCGANHRGQRNSGGFDDDFFSKITAAEWDSQPDKFFFSFLGMSGSMRMSPNGVPVLESSEGGIKIEYSPFNSVNGRMNGGAEEWIIRDQKGNRYFFGGTSTETTTSTTHGETENKTKVFISSWFISKIITASNQTILFSYSTGAQTSYSYFVNVRRTNSVQGMCSYGGPADNFWNENVDVSVSAPLYLNEIKTDDGRTVINFLYEHQREDIVNAKAMTGVTLKYNGVQKHKYILDYGYFLATDGSAAKRLKLNGIREIGTLGGEIRLFDFFYNEAVTLPERNSIKTDYWGYYNKNYGSSNIEGYQGGFKGADLEYTKACVLTKVNNKTGGTIYFEYELNDFSQNNANKTAGGLRLKRKFERTADSNQEEVVMSEEYDYKIPGGSVSSGQQFVSQSNRELLVDLLIAYATPVGMGYCVFSNRYYYSEPLISIFDLNNNSVGYSFVSVKKLNGTVRYNFTNFSDNPDVFDTRLFDTYTDQESAAGTPAYNIRPQFAGTSLAFARGKIKSEEIFGLDGQKVKETVFTYEFTPAVNTIIGIKAFAQKFLGTDKTYTFGRYQYANQDYKLKTKTDKIFRNGLEVSHVKEEYEYTSFAKNLVASKKTTNIAGNSKQEVNKYPFDNPSDPALADMVSRNQIAETVEQWQYVNNVFLKKEVKSYNLWAGGITAPLSVAQGLGNFPMVDKLLLNLYDSQSNVLETQTPNGKKEAFFYGYDNRYLIAKVTGEGYNTAKQFIDQNMLFSAYNYTEQQIRDELNKLRVNLPNAVVTTNTYDPLVGMTSQTDGKGNTTRYEYDEFQRLKYIYDQHGNIVKNFNYHYHAPYIYNDAQFAVFTKQGCPIGYTPEQVGYIVQANTVFSVNSKQEANQFALDELNAKGQENANLTGRCKPSSLQVDYAYSTLKPEICSFTTSPIAIQLIQGFVKNQDINDPISDTRIYWDDYLTYPIPDGFYVQQGITNFPVVYQFIEDGYVKYSNTCGQDDPLQFGFSTVQLTGTMCSENLTHRYAFVNDPYQMISIGTILSLPFSIIEDGYYVRGGQIYTVSAGVVVAVENCGGPAIPVSNSASMTLQSVSIVGICQSDNYANYFYSDPSVSVGTVLYRNASLTNRVQPGYYFDTNRIYIVVRNGEVYGIQTCQEVADGLFLAHPPFEPTLEPVSGEPFTAGYSLNRSSICNPVQPIELVNLYSASAPFNFPVGIGAPEPVYYLDSALQLLAPDGYYTLQETDPAHTGVRLYYLRDGKLLFVNWCDMIDPVH